jgi:hypothetical protein
MKSEENVGGAAYGPYMIARYAQPNTDGSSTVFFILSV